MPLPLDYPTKNSRSLLPHKRQEQIQEKSYHCTCKGLVVLTVGLVTASKAEKVEKKCRNGYCREEPAWKPMESSTYLALPSGGLYLLSTRAVYLQNRLHSSQREKKKKTLIPQESPTAARAESAWNQRIQMPTPQTADRPRRPATRSGFDIVVICALTLEADAVGAALDVIWDNDDDPAPPFLKAPHDPNTYCTGAIGRHNVVLAYMPGMGKVNAALVAANCRLSFPNIRLALVVGVCGVAPYTPGGSEEILLGDVIISTGVVQYDIGRRLPDGFHRKDTLLDTLGRPNLEIRGLLAKLQGIEERRQLGAAMSTCLEDLQTKPPLSAGYPGAIYDVLFEATYLHAGEKMSCEESGCDGTLVQRKRLEYRTSSDPPGVHFGLVASGDTVVKCGADRDRLAATEGVIAFEMESAGVWDLFPCVVIKGACDYADSHKSKVWQRYAAATAAACLKVFLGHWRPAVPAGLNPAQPAGPFFIVPYPKNKAFVGRRPFLDKLRETVLVSSPPRLAIFGLGGIGSVDGFSFFSITPSVFMCAVFSNEPLSGKPRSRSSTHIGSRRIARISPSSGSTRALKNGSATGTRVSQRSATSQGLTIPKPTCCR
ncbi:hypothetical protein ASPCAL04216 [Aspergillus calidoustus]|uniref:Nucleoside phosphorylase domain-containing protein n=1 Tax=Aspergillus calidoustus TaxID=454130 RepID=A0A0U5FU19_ASPCI|nr:hypothetical protein ASPCAL04216 [Aspergillus calidoustus]